MSVERITTLAKIQVRISVSLGVPIAIGPQCITAATIAIQVVMRPPSAAPAIPSRIAAQSSNGNGKKKSRETISFSSTPNGSHETTATAASTPTTSNGSRRSNAARLRLSVSPTGAMRRMPMACVSHQRSNIRSNAPSFTPPTRSSEITLRSAPRAAATPDASPINRRMSRTRSSDASKFTRRSSATATATSRPFAMPVATTCSGSPPERNVANAPPSAAPIQTGKGSSSPAVTAMPLDAQIIRRSSTPPNSPNASVACPIVA